MDVQEMPRGGISQVQLVGLLTMSLVAVVIAANLFTGLLGLAFWLFVVARFANWREAVVTCFAFSCVLASSREPGLQYWKMLRLIPAALVALEALKIFQLERQHFRRRHIFWLATIVLCTGIPAILSDNARDGLFETALLGSMWFVLMILGTHQTPTGSKHRVQILLLLGSVVAISSSLVSFVVPEIGFLKGRWRGVFGNPNEFGHWWLFIFVLALFHVRGNGRSSMIWVGATVVILLLTGTRGALLGAVVAGMGSVLEHALQRKTILASAFFGISAVGALVVAIQYEPWAIQEDLLPKQLVRSETISSGGGRTIAWQHALEEIYMEPWFGQGGGYEQRYFKTRYTFFAGQNHEGASHNSWIAFAMNYGIPGGTLLILSLLIRLNLASRSARLVYLPAIVISLTVEGWLTAPMSASSPLLFLVGGYLGHGTAIESEN